MYPETLNCDSDPRLPPAQRLAQGVVHAAAAELADALNMIEHCLAQLSDEQIWRRDAPALHALGNIVLHLAGNLRQWVVAGLGHAADVRQRPQEFAACEPIPRQQLLAELQNCVREARAVIESLTPDELLRTRRIQGFEMTGIATLWHTVAHFRGHAQEIIRLTRERLGPAYRFAWVPQTPEQGAAE